MFPEARGECEELNNFPQIEAAADGRPLTRYAESLETSMEKERVWRLGWRTREFGEQGWRAREFEDQGWRAREFGDQGWRRREFGDQGWRSRENGDCAGKARVPCAKADNGTSPDFGLFREFCTGRRSATSRKWSVWHACPQAPRKSAGRQQWAEHRLEAVREGHVGQTGGTDFGPGVERSSGPFAKREITVPGGPI